MDDLIHDLTALGLTLETDPLKINGAVTTRDGIELRGPAAYLAVHGPFALISETVSYGVGELGESQQFLVECIGPTRAEAAQVERLVRSLIFRPSKPWRLLTRSPEFGDLGVKISLLIQRNWTQFR